MEPPRRSRGLHTESSRPEIGDWRRAIYILGIKLSELLSGFALYPLSQFADFVGKTLAVFRNVFEDDFVQQHWHGIKVARKGVGADTERFQRNRATAGKRIDD